MRRERAKQHEPSHLRTPISALNQPILRTRSGQREPDIIAVCSEDREREANSMNVMPGPDATISLPEI